MNFFEQQEQAKRQSRKLFVAFAFAVIAIIILVDVVVAFAAAYIGATNSNLNQFNLFSGAWLQNNAGLMLASTLITSGFIGAASMYKSVRLGFGGGTVAKDMGGTQITADVRDPLRKRLFNVVEEMCIASGLPMPEIYVLEEEAAINAFAAGSQPSNAAIAVTRGALEHFDRDELQGVIAHEFSHILNGDMRINIRLMGVLFGILIISLIGRTLLRSSRHARYSRRNENVSIVLVIGMALAVIGYVGLTMGRLIKAAVSRQREFLADASAVQFTRQTDGIKMALMKIAASKHSSVFKASDAEEVSHMLFSSGLKMFGGAFATHPPLPERLLALDPHFKPDDINKLALDMVENARKVAERAEQELKAEQEKSDKPGQTDAFGKALGGLGVLLPGAISDAVGNPAIQHVMYAEVLRQQLPRKLLDAAHDQDKDVFDLTLALLLHPDVEQRLKQLAVLNKQMGQDRTNKVIEYFTEVQQNSDQFRLPLLDLAFPALKRRTQEELNFLRDLIDRIVHTDNKIEPFEYALSRVLASHLADTWAPYAQGKVEKKPAKITAAITHLFAVISLEGSHDHAINAEAYEDGIKYFIEHPNSKRLLKHLDQEALQRFETPDENWIHDLDQGLLSLDALPMKIKRALIEALSITIAFDDEVSQVESELLRAICSTLHCPMPPILKTQASVS
ncbi:MAG: M48 family metallopeptidase [Gammaproteobacteria bacterium]|nr:M48 family metallopeptidase [Gammaproteobacteria bacterium]